MARPDHSRRDAEWLPLRAAVSGRGCRREGYPKSLPRSQLPTAKTPQDVWLRMGTRIPGKNGVLARATRVAPLLIICVSCLQLALCLQTPAAVRPGARQTVWLEDLCAWLRLRKRRPRRFGARVGLSETELEERLQYKRCSQVRRLYRKHALSQNQLDMLLPLENELGLQRRHWLEELCAWLSLHKRRPHHFEGTVGLNESQVEERLQYKRCAAVRRLHRRNELSQKQLDMLQPFWNEIQISTTAVEKRTAWVEDLCAWLRLHKRRPHRFRAKGGCLNSTELEERLQYQRCESVVRLRRRNELSQEHLHMLQPFENETGLQCTHWLGDLCAWLRLHERRPRRLRAKVGLNQTELEELVQYGRCSRVRKLHRRNELSQQQLDMLQPLWSKIQLDTTAVEAKRTAWVEDLRAWLRIHKRCPRHFERQAKLNGTELQEKLQYERCTRVRRLLRTNALSEEHLNMLQPFRSRIEAGNPSRAAGRLPRADWLEDLCDWLQFHRRRPRPLGTKTEPWLL